MKTIFKIMSFCLLLLGAAACSDEETAVADPTLEVNYANVSGTWRLDVWNGTKLENSLYFYITFNRKEVDGKRTYEIYQNIDSPLARHITGTFNIENDEELGSILSGTYDYWQGEWNQSYLVSELRGTSMTWTVKDDLEDISVYTRCAEVPEDIVKGIRSAGL